MVDGVPRAVSLLVHLFLSRRCPGVSPSHVHVPLGGPSYLSGVPATRGPAVHCAIARGLGFGRSSSATGASTLLASALEIYMARSGAPGCPPVDLCDALQVWGGRKLVALGRHLPESLLYPLTITRHLLRSPLPISITMGISLRPGRNRLRHSSFLLQTLQTPQVQGRSRPPGTGLEGTLHDRSPGGP